MISFLHPAFLFAAMGASAVVVALHFLVAEQPRAGVLPTVRFFPDVEVRSTALTVRLSDLVLLFVRALTLLLIGAAFAQPQLKPSRSAVLRILAVDVSRDVDHATDTRDSAAKYLAGAATFIAFDSVVSEMSTAAAGAYLEDLQRAPRTNSHGSFSSALIVALRAGSRLRERADSVELVFITPLLAEETDRATASIRSLWPGRVTLVRVAAARDTVHAPVAPILQWADSAAGGSSWVARSQPDTIGGVQLAGGVVVYPFIRRWKMNRADTSARVIARWVDGEAAVVEQKTPSGCRRSISVPVPATGDAMLRPSFVRFFETLSANCAGGGDHTPPSPEFVKAFEGPPHLAATSSIRPEAARMTPLVPWLLGSAIFLALLELLLRRRAERRRARRDENAAEEATGEFPVEKTA
jgi:hypothetical protein